MEPTKEGAGEPDALKLVVGIGASAGGLEVLEDFLKAMPADAGVTLIVVQHLSPDHPSHMVPLLAKHTSMPVASAEDGMRLTPNAIFLIPPKKVLTVAGGALRLAERGAGLVLPVDILFKSIAEEYRERCAGIVLSGTGSDGLRGVRAIKEVGGLVLVQDPATAKFDGMPRAAASSGVADFILPVRELPNKLVGYVAHSHALVAAAPHGGVLEDVSVLDGIFGIVRRQTAVDFSSYKPSTIQRRIQRRMAITQTPTIEDYRSLVERSTQEVSALFREFLINVTRFFRDSDVFEQVRRDVIPALVEKTRPGESIRVWVPGCSTGEEAYSLAMLFEEHFEAGGRPRDVKIFATDIDPAALEVAGAGLYHDSIAADVSPERLTRFFNRQGEVYQVARFLRQRVVFANHDLTRDPPFSRVSMVSCRNLLIYFDTPLQARVLSAFRFALKPGGFLLLGSSETAGEVTSELLPITGSAKLYLRTDAPAVSREARPRGAGNAPGQVAAEPANGRVDARLVPALETLALACAPPTVLINEQHEVLHFFGPPTPLVRLGSGAPSLNLLQLLPTSVGSILSLATHRALRDSEDVQYGPVQTELGALRLHVRVVPGTGGQRQLLVSFQLPNADQASADEPVAVNLDAQQQIGDLQQELQYSRESLQATIEELETSNEELQATNEELVASNEELQATNEELQSVNEELHSLNAEYQRKIEELVRLNDDVDNLLLSTRIGLIFLDQSLQVARFTSPMTELMNLLPRDVGRPIKDISFRFDATWFYAALQTVRETRQPMDRDHTLSDGKTYLIRVAPYISETQAGRGFVVTALNVTDARGIEKRLGAVLDALPYQVAVLQSDGTIVAVNAEWLRFGLENGGVKPSSLGVGANYLSVCEAGRAGSADASAVADALGAMLAGKREDFELEYPCDSGRERRWFLMQARAIPPQGAVVSHLNITRRKVLELEVQAGSTGSHRPPMEEASQ